MKFRSSLIFMAAVALFVSEQSVKAINYPIDAINTYYNIEASYNEKNAYIGNRNLELLVTMSTPISLDIPASARLVLVSVESIDETRIKITPLVSRERVQEDAFLKNQYRFKLEIGEGVEPRIYKLILKFRDANNTSIQRYVDLGVGVRSKGKLRFIEGAPETLVLNGVADINLKFANDYPDYTININKIEIISDPPGLIKSATLKDDVVSKPSQRSNVILPDPGISIDPSQQRSVSLELKLGGIPSVQYWLFGFGDSSKLKFDISYDDGNGRSISDFTTEAKVKVKPGDWFLIMMLVSGLLCGSLLLLFFDYLRKKRFITRRSFLVFAASTLVIGLVTAIVALVGQIQIVAFQKVDLSYDVPGAIFVMGIAAASGGTYFLRTWFEKPNNKGA